MVHKDKLELFYGQAQKSWLPDPMSARNYGLLGEQSLVATSVSTLSENYNVTTAELAAMGSAVDSIPIEVDYTDENFGPTKSNWQGFGVLCSGSGYGQSPPAVRLLPSLPIG